MMTRLLNVGNLVTHGCLASLTGHGGVNTLYWTINITSILGFLSTHILVSWRMFPNSSCYLTPSLTRCRSSSATDEMRPWCWKPANESDYYFTVKRALVFPGCGYDNTVIRKRWLIVLRVWGTRDAIAYFSEIFLYSHRNCELTGISLMHKILAIKTIKPIQKNYSLWTYTVCVVRWVV